LCRKIKTPKRRNIWIIGVKDTEDSMLATPICKDFWDLKCFKENVYSKIEEGAYVISYGDRYLYAFAKEHTKKLFKKSKNSRQAESSERSEDNLI